MNDPGNERSGNEPISVEIYDQVYNLRGTDPSIH